MLKNIIFDFGNVIMNYNPDEILNHYELRPADHDLLRKTIFESKKSGARLMLARLRKKRQLKYL